MKQAIALAGGGTKGAYQVGAWKAMRELGIPFDIVTGTSIGSVTAALMVQDDFDRAWELWTHITEEQIMLEREDATPREKRELAALAEHPEQLIARVQDWADLNRRTADITPYRALVHQYLDEARFFASPVDFGLMTARFPSFQPVEVRKRDIAPGYLPQWILASSACYPMFPMCEIDGQSYIDGGYADNLPNFLDKSDASSYNYEGCGIDISWAVDENRQPVNLDFVDFVRVYTGLNQKCPQPEWWGETSTEFAGAEDIHLEASIEAIKNALSGIRTIEADDADRTTYDLQGRKVIPTKKGIYIQNKKKYFIK